MAKAPRYKKKNHKTLWYIAIIILVLLGVLCKRNNNDIELQDLLSKSSDIHSVNLNVKEIIAPQSKIKAYLVEDKTNPIISINFSFLNSGYVFDKKGKKGLAKLTSLLINEGTTELSSMELKDELELKAIRVRFDVDKDDFMGSLLTTKDNLFRAVELINNMLTKPRLGDEDIKRIKIQLQEGLKRQIENPYQELQLAFAEEIYKNHPYADNPLGKKEDIKHISANDMREFVKKYLRKDNVIVGIVGDITEFEAQKILDIMFNGLEAGNDLNEITVPKIDFDGRNRKIARNGGQNISMVALKSVKRNDKDFYPLFVANHILGGAGLTSKLSQQVREQEGLTYGIYSYLLINDNAPLMVMSFSATKDNYMKANESWRKIFNDFRNKGVNSKELQKAKDYLIGSYNLRFASIENISEILTAMQKYNLGLDFLQKRNEYIKKINIEEVNDVAKKYFDVNKIISAEIGEFQGEDECSETK